MPSSRPPEWRDARHVPEMPQMPDSEDIEATWRYIEIGLNRIIFEPSWGTDVQSLVGLYTAVQNFCTSQKAVRDTQFSGGHRGAHLLGEDLYVSLTKYLHQYLDMLKRRFKSLRGQSLLDLYLEDYAQFMNSAKIIDNIFRYLNRHWIKRESDTGRDVHDIYTLQLVLWHSELFQEISHDLVNVISDLVQKHHSGEIGESGSSKNLIEFIISLELDATNSTQPLSEAYGSILEIPIRQAIRSSSETRLLQLFYSEYIPNYEHEPACTEMENRLVTLISSAGLSQPLTRPCNDTEMVKLVTSDLVVVEVEQKVAECSILIKRLCAYFGREIIANEFIALPNVKESTLRRVLEWCDHHKDDIDTGLTTADTDKDTTDIGEWDQKYMEVDQEALFDIVLAANYLDIKPLLDLGCKSIANLIKGRSPEEIRRTFNITNDFTPEEEEQIRRENEWSEDR